MTEIKFYTSTGDDGTTGLLGKERVKKYHPQPEAYGDVDEAQAMLGLARAGTDENEIRDILIKLQRDLYTLMAELATTKENAEQFRGIGPEQVKWLEEQTDHYGEQLTLPKEFIISGDTLSGAYLDVARTIIRRAERKVVKLYDDKFIENVYLIHYLNRLSSLAFVLARYLDALSGKSSITLAKGNV